MAENDRKGELTLKNYLQAVGIMVVMAVTIGGSIVLWHKFGF